jgi:uncharacterized protein
MTTWRTLACGLLVAALTGCATYSERTQLARDAAQTGNLVASEKVLNKFMRTKDSRDLPVKWKKETIVALLERAMVLHARGEWKLSARDMGVADKQLVLLDIARDPGQIGKWIFSDSAGQYHAPPSEKLALNAFNLLNYLMLGDLSGARVEAKRFTITREYLATTDAGKDAHGAFGSYLAGFAFERLGEADTALRYYDEALQQADFASLHAPIRRLAARSAYRTPRLRAILGEAEAAPSASLGLPAQALLAQTPAPAPEPVPEASPAAPEAAPVLDRTPTLATRAEPGELLIVMNIGRVPFKIPERMPIGLAIGLGATWITGDTTILQHSALKFVIYPELAPSQALFNTGELLIDGREHPMELATNLDAEIVREYDLLRPKIIGAAITRLIVRAAVAEAARAAGKQAKGEAGAIVGLFAALAAEGALVAADKPDTRSWTLLPAFVFVARVPVSMGTHTVTVTASGSGGRERHEFTADVKPGGFVVVDVTTLR